MVKRVKLFGLILLVLLGFSLSSHAQLDEKKTLRQAQRFFLFEDFNRAAENYKLLADSFPEVFKYNYEIALLLFYELDKKPSSVSYLNKAISLMAKDSLPQLYLYLGQAYQAKGRYDSAIYAYKYYKAIDSNFIKVSVKRYINSCELGKELRNKSAGNIIVENLGNIINTESAEYLSVFLNNYTEMLFTSRRNKNIYDELIEVIYLSKIENDKFSSPVKIETLTEYNNLIMDVNEFESVVGVLADGKSLIIYYDPYLYIAHYTDSSWTKPEKLPDEINFNFVTTHASITEDGNNIYFAGYDKKNSGNIDIFHSERINGKWSTSQKLPSFINTRKREDSPEISPDGNTLYFSSDGLSGMGHYDVYKTQLVDSQWTEPENMGAPINSSADDIYFHMHKNSEGTLSSNRDGGFGKMDIYKVTFNEEEPKPVFNNCKAGTLGRYGVIFDASKSRDPIGSKVFYEWEFGDGAEGKGSRVSHSYTKPGNYKAYLNIVDSVTGAIEKHEKELNVKIENVNYLNFDCDTIVKLGDMVRFDASLFAIKGVVVNDIYWQPETDSVKQGITINYTFNNAGTFQVKMKALYNLNDQEVEQCIYREIKVLSKNDYENYIIEDK